MFGIICVQINDIELLNTMKKKSEYKCDCLIISTEEEKIENLKMTQTN